jgi:hypothetical protein
VVPGTTIRGYRIEGEIGRGGMGVVYRATQIDLGRTVALKLIAPDLSEDPEFVQRFQRESRTAASIEHPNVIPVYDAGEEAGRVFIAMRLVEGADLGQRLERDGAMDPARAANVMAQIAAALDAAHAHGLVHRDVKPANVLIEGDAGSETAYLTDFGLTKRAESESGMTLTGHFVGTVDYIAPEQARGEAVDARTDVYALGCLLFRMLTGEVPYPRDSAVAKIFAHVNDPPPSVSDRAGAGLGPFDAVIERAMAKDPAHRFPSAGDLARAAEAAARGQELPKEERSVARGEAAPGRRSRFGRYAVIGAVLLLFLGTGAGVAMVMTSGDDPPPPGPTTTATEAAPPGPDDTLFARAIGPVQLKMSTDEVEQNFGTPDDTEQVNLGTGSDPQEDWIWNLPQGEVRLQFSNVGGGLTGYNVQSPEFETDAGISVSDTRADVEKAYPGATPGPIGDSLVASDSKPGEYPALEFFFEGTEIFAIHGGSPQPAGE